jgi:hypothetical protein
MEQRLAELTQAGAAAEADAWPEARANLEADIDPEALAVMASVEADFAVIDDNLVRAQAGAERLAEKRAHDQAKRERARSTSLSSTPAHRPSWKPQP